MMFRVWPMLLLIGGFSAGTASAAITAAPPAGRVAHRYFGALQSVRGTIVTLRLRNGRLLVVDAALAFAADRVSQPLFVGKATVVQGAFGANNTFYASVVNRAAPRASSWGVDR